MAEARVYLVDDNDGFRESTAWLLETAGFETLSYGSGADFLAAYGGDRHGDLPECLVSDIRMPEMSGLQLQDELQRHGIALPLVFVTAHGDVPLAVEAMRAGAYDFIEKPFDAEHLLSQVLGALDDYEDAPALPVLSKRQRAVLERVLAGKPNRQIAEELDISLKTVEFHRARIMEKLGVRTAAELFRRCLGSN